MIIYDKIVVYHFDTNKLITNGYHSSMKLIDYSDKN